MAFEVADVRGVSALCANTFCRELAHGVVLDRDRLGGGVSDETGLASKVGLYVQIWAAISHLAKFWQNLNG